MNRYTPKKVSASAVILALIIGLAINALEGAKS